MAKVQKKRSLPKQILLWADTVDTQMTRVRGYVLDPYTLTYDQDIKFDSGAINDQNTNMKVIGEKFVFFLKQCNYSGEYEMRPQLVIWDSFQNSLIINLHEKINDNIRKEIVLLQDQLYQSLKYNLMLQSLSMEEIGSYLGIDGEPNVKFAKLAIWNEHINREIAKKFKVKR